MFPDFRSSCFVVFVPGLWLSTPEYCLLHGVLLTQASSSGVHGHAGRLVTARRALAPASGNEARPRVGWVGLREVVGLYFRDLFNLGKNLTFSYF